MATANPNTIYFASGGNGSPQQIAMQIFKSRTGIKLTHVPYRGATGALTDVVSCTVPLMFTAVAIARSFIKSGKLRALATGGKKRSDFLPDVPTVAEAGVAGFKWSTWIKVPSKTPPAISKKLYDAAIAALKDSEVREKLLAARALRFERRASLHTG